MLVGMRTRWARMMMSVVAGVSLAVFGGASAASGREFVNWPSYLLNTSHSSANTAATAITASKIAGLHAVWKFVPGPPTMAGQPSGGFVSSPIVSNGTVFVGANTGEFSALNESTGKVIWKAFTGFQPKITCAARGTAATATVAPDPVSHRSMVYLAGADGNLYAFDALSGAVHWHSVVNTPSSSTNDFFAWGSAAVAGGRIFVGSASNCDAPLVQGSLQSFDQATGKHLATYVVVPSGAVGGGIWTTAAATPTEVWVTTGNADETGSQPGDSNSIVRLDAATLTVQDKWTVPGITNVDLDLGASPTLFTGTVGRIPTPMVGACGKNGIFYAWQAQKLSVGPQWTQVVGASALTGPGMCLASATWDAGGSRLFEASNTTTIAGTKYPGALREFNPSTGAPVWQLGLNSGPVFGSTSLNGSNIIAAVTYSRTATNDLFLVDATHGTILRTIALDSPTFAQPTFADHYLMVATGRSLTAWSS